MAIKAVEGGVLEGFTVGKGETRASLLQLDDFE